MSTANRKKINKFMLEVGANRAELATLLDVHATSVSRYLNGRGESATIDMRFRKVQKEFASTGYLKAFQEITGLKKPSAADPQLELPVHKKEQDATRITPMGIGANSIFEFASRELTDENLKILSLIVPSLTVDHLCKLRSGDAQLLDIDGEVGIQIM